MKPLTKAGITAALRGVPKDNYGNDKAVNPNVYNKQGLPASTFQAEIK
jgi:hypothetical protein